MGQQYQAVGVQSIPLIIAASLFMGLVVGVQIGMQIEQVTPPWIEAGVMLRVILIDMGPIIIGVIMAGCVVIVGTDVTDLTEGEYNAYVRDRMSMVFQRGALRDGAKRES